MTVRSLVAFAAIFFLAACGGGGGSGGSGGPFPVPNSVIQDLTNSHPPQETPAEASSRLRDVVSRTDSVLVSTWFLQPQDPSDPTLHAQSSCAATTCMFHEPRNDLSWTVSEDDLQYDPTVNKTILSKHGITMSKGSLSYGSLMDHSFFSAFSDHDDVIEGVNVWSRFSYAGGELTGSRPSTSANWHGIMVGVPLVASARNKFLQGDAVLTYDFSGSSLDALFTNIKDITRNRAHSVSSVGFSDVPVDSSGTFQAATTGNRIQGGLYGPGHAETAGIFEHSGIVGSFGAKKQ